MMSGQWTPGNIGLVHSQAESSAAAATRAAASLATDIGFQPMAECAAQAGAGFAPMPPAFFRPLAFFSVGTLVQMVPTSTSTSPSMATPAQRNLFSTPHEYVPPSSLEMPPEMMVSPSPDASNSGGTICLAAVAPDHQPDGSIPTVIVATSSAAGRHHNISIGCSADGTVPARSSCLYAHLANYMTYMLGYQPHAVASQPHQEQPAVQQHMPALQLQQQGLGLQ